MKKCLTLVSLALLAVAAGAKTDSKVQGDGIVERAYAAWNAHDPEKVLAFYTTEMPSG